MATQEITPVICQQCQTRYNAPCQTIIDVSQNPALKSNFLQGRLSISQCPQCATVNPLTNPILYHDAEKELALAYVPNSMQIGHLNEQKAIGSLSNRLMNALPPEQRKAYLFTPQTFLTLDSLVKAVLAADGITEEVMAAQQKKLSLLNRLFSIQDETALKSLIQKHEAELDYQFFELLTSMALQALQEGNQEQGQSMLAFRQLIAEWRTGGKDIVAQLDEKIGLQTLNPETLLAALQEAQTEKDFMAAISAGKPILNYEFFQNLTNEIDAAAAKGNKAEAEELKALRARILDASARLDDEARKLMAQAGQLLQQLLEAPEPQKFIEENVDNIDDAFMSLLIANAQEAEKQGNQALVEKLGALYQLIIDTIQKLTPPEMALLNALLQAQSPENIKTILEQNKPMLTPDFVSFLNTVEGDFQSRGQAEMAAAISEIKKQVEAMV